MTTSIGAIDAYMTRLRDLAAGTNHIDRFYLFLADEQLYDMEYEISNSIEAGAFYERLLEQYQAWKDAMGPELWAEVLAYNESLNGANQNALLDEA